MESAFGAMRESLFRLAGENLPAAAPRTRGLWAHRSEPYVIAGSASLATLQRAGLGGNRLRWQARLRGPLRGFAWRALESAVALPADAVVVISRLKPTGSVLSAAEGAVLKVSAGEAAAALERENGRIADPKLVAQGLAPRLLSSGREDGLAWGVHEFCRIEPDADAAVLTAELLPRLFAWWEAEGLEWERAADLVARVEARAAALGLADDLSAALARVAALRADAGDFACPRVLTHGDLQPRHLMRGTDGRLLLIDWDASARRGFLADLQRIAPAKALFQPGEDPIQPAHRPVADAMIAWANGQGAGITSPDRFALLNLATLLERICEIAGERGIAFSDQQRTVRSLTFMGLAPATAGS